MPHALRLPVARAAAVALTLFLPFALTACGGETTAASEASSTRTVTGADGSRATLPTHPKRVVALTEPTLDGVLALGVEPVGTISGRGQKGVPGYLAAKAGDVPILGSVAALDYEAIAKAKPDVILLDGTGAASADVRKILGKIAPVYYAGNAGGDWRVTFTNVASALNKQAAAKKVVAAYEAKVATAKKSLKAYAGDTFSIVRWQGSSASLILKELPAGAALDDLGLERPPSQDRKGPGHSVPVSLENLGQIDADHIFFGTLGGSSEGNPAAGGASDTSGAQKALAEAAKVPGFDRLGAYRSKQIYPVDGALWTSTGGPLLMSGLIDDVVKVLP